MLRNVESVSSHELPSDGGAVRRLITIADGSSVLLGHCVMSPGQCARFALSDGAEETYFLLSGELDVESAAGRLTATAGDAMYFPSEATYAVSVIGSERVELIYTVSPAYKEAK